MKVGVHLVNFTLPGGPPSIGPTLATAARAAEDAGVTNLSLMDHYFQLEMMGAADQPMLEGYTSLGFLAGLTSTVELQLLVTGVTYRHPGLLAKIVSTLDVLSGGRAVLGIGAAWYEREHRALGVAYPPLAERFERLEETLLQATRRGRFRRWEIRRGCALRCLDQGQLVAPGPEQPIATPGRRLTRVHAWAASAAACSWRVSIARIFFDAMIRVKRSSFWQRMVGTGMNGCGV